jgi:hypothetical protein
MNTSSIRLPLGIAAALAAIAVSAPAAGAAGLDPAIYDQGVLPGQVEHGVYTLTISGSPTPMNRRTEYWISADRWREQTTDTKTGELIGGRLHDAGGTTWLQYKPINGDPKVLHFNGNDSVPGPGYPAAYNRKLAETGVTQGPEKSPIAVTLQPIGPQTIAGFAGTRYEQLSNGEPGLVAVGQEPRMPDVHSIVVLQDGTYQPLLRETSGPNGEYGTFVQRETLISRETTSAADAGVQLTKLGFARTVTKWKAKVKAAKAAAKKKKHHKK